MTGAMVKRRNPAELEGMAKRLGVSVRSTPPGNGVVKYTITHAKGRYGPVVFNDAYTFLEGFGTGYDQAWSDAGRDA